MNSFCLSVGTFRKLFFLSAILLLASLDHKTFFSDFDYGSLRGKYFFFAAVVFRLLVHAEACDWLSINLLEASEEPRSSCFLMEVTNKTLLENVRGLKNERWVAAGKLSKISLKQTMMIYMCVYG